METKTRAPDTGGCGSGLDEELAGILTAISVVSRRLAQKLLTLQRRDDHAEEGGVRDG